MPKFPLNQYQPRNELLAVMLAGQGEARCEKGTLMYAPFFPLLEQNYCESRYHFLHSTDGEGCANMLVEYSSSRGYRSEVDMFVAQAVLQ